MQFNAAFNEEWLRRKKYSANNKNHQPKNTRKSTPKAIYAVGILPFLYPFNNVDASRRLPFDWQSLWRKIVEGVDASRRRKRSAFN